MVREAVKGVMNGEKVRRSAPDGRGIGGFYEAIMAMMVVTAGVVLLTATMALLSADRGEDSPDSIEKCDEVTERLLSDPSLVISTRLLDGRSLSHFEIGDILRDWSGGARVMLTFADGGTAALFDSGDEAALDRACRSEAINVQYSQADVRAAVLTVWVWS